MKSDEQIKSELKEIEASTIQKVCDILRSYNQNTYKYLADMVAAVCNVDVNDMLTDTKHIQHSHARWFFWFAYRYMTNENYDSIAKNTSQKRRFTVACVGYCVSKMSMMVETEPMWIKRWTIIKHVIKVMLDNSGNQQDRQQTLIVKVQPPKGVDVSLELIK